MKVLIHASLDFKSEMVLAKKFIEKHSDLLVDLPDLERYQPIRDELGDDKKFTEIKNKLSRQNIELVEQCDCLLILNYDHRGIQNYVGGNSFLEMVIAFYLRKPIYLLKDIPLRMSYTEEIKAFYPKVVHSLEGFIKEII
jgi:nucleoside 2-deoxyribosyltransferase